MTRASPVDAFESIRARMVAEWAEATRLDEVVINMTISDRGRQLIGDLARKSFGEGLLRGSSLESKLRASLRPRAHKAYADMPYSQQAALRCNDPDFQRFLRVTHDIAAAARVREQCGVASRANILKGEGSGAVWEALDRQFLDWKRTR